MTSKKKKIAWFSAGDAAPLSYSSLFSKAVAPLLEEEFEIVNFVADADLDRNPDFGLHFHQASMLHRNAPFDYFVYLVEDRPESRFVTTALKTSPGLVLFHDVNLNRQYLSQLKHSTGGTDLTNEARELFGESVPDVGQWHTRSWSFEILDSIFVRGEAELQAASIAYVTNEMMLEDFKRTQKQDLDASRLSPPSFLGEPKPESLPIGSEIIIFGSAILGDRVFDALEIASLASGTLQENLQMRWIVDCSTDTGELLDAIERFSSSAEAANLTIAVSQVSSLPEFLSYLEAARVAICLESSVGRGIPAFLQLALEYGVPLIVSDVGASKDLSSSGCISIAQGIEGRLFASKLIAELFKSDSMCHLLGMDNVQFSKSYFSTERTVEDLRETLLREQAQLESRSRSRFSEVAKAQEEYVRVLSAASRASVNRIIENEEMEDSLVAELLACSRSLKWGGSDY